MGFSLCKALCDSLCFALLSKQVKVGLSQHLHLAGSES